MAMILRTKCSKIQRHWRFLNLQYPFYISPPDHIDGEAARNKTEEATSQFSKMKGYFMPQWSRNIDKGLYSIEQKGESVKLVSPDESGPNWNRSISSSCVISQG